MLLCGLKDETCTQMIREYRFHRLSDVALAARGVTAKRQYPDPVGVCGDPLHDPSILVSNLSPRNKVEKVASDDRVSVEFRRAVLHGKCIPVARPDALDDGVAVGGKGQARQCFQMRHVGLKPPQNDDLIVKVATSHDHLDKYVPDFRRLH